MRKDDEIRLRHMMDAAREALAFSRNHSRSDLDHNRMLEHSPVRCIEIIGEAASQVTAACLPLTAPVMVGCVESSWLEALDGLSLCRV